LIYTVVSRTRADSPSSVTTVTAANKVLEPVG
jgi:hypothetical protein